MTVDRKAEFEVVVAGAGPTGLMLAQGERTLKGCIVSGSRLQ